MRKKLFQSALFAVMFVVALTFHGQEAAGYSTEELLKLSNQIQNENPGIKLEIKTDKAEYSIGEDVVFQFKADKDCYVALLDIGSSGKTIVLFPNKWHVENRIEKDRIYNIPPLGSNFTYRVMPPVGTERIKVLASLDPVLSKIQSLQEELKQPIETGPEKGQVFLSMKNPSVVMKDIGVAFQKIDHSKWATKEYSFKIVEAAPVTTPPPAEPPKVTTETRPPEEPGVFKGKDGLYEIKYDHTKWTSAPVPGETAEAAFTHGSGELDVVVIVQQVSGEVSVEMAKKAFLEYLKAMIGDITLKEEKEIKSNNYTVTSMTLNGKIEGTPFIFNGYLWVGKTALVQLISSCPESAFPKFREDVEKFLNGLVILKP